MHMSKLPIIAIVGQPNVGKSSLFNRLVGERQAIVYDIPGTTRDSVQNIIHFGAKSAWLVDTAGIDKARDSLQSSIQDQVQEAIDYADVIILSIDVVQPLTQSEQMMAKQLLKSKKPIILSANKIDKNKNEIPKEVIKLGIKEVIGTSAIHGDGSEELIEAVFDKLPKVKAEPDTKNTIALVGRPNVGKSSLFNNLAGKNQAVVSKIAGTTRDVNRTTATYDDITYQILDTAGLRRKSQAKDIERISWLRTIAAINAADVVVLVIDATEPSVTADQRIGGFIKDAQKGLIIAINKWDLVKKEPDMQQQLELRLQHDFGFAWWAPMVLTSATGNHNVKKLMGISAQIIKRRQTKFKTPELNNVMQMAMAKHPPAGLKNRHPKLNYVTQTDENPPEITLFGKHLEFLHWSYKRYLENNLRERYDLIGTPIAIRLREKTGSKKS